MAASMMASAIRFIVPPRSERVVVGFAGTDAERLFEIEHENFAVADLTGLGARLNRLDRLLGNFARHRHFDFHLRQEVHGVFGAAVELGMPLLPAVPLYFRHG